jgi:hypothetical protein
MPLFHIGGLSANLLSSLAAGASVILLPQFNAADFFGRHWKANVLFVWPSLLSLI